MQAAASGLEHVLSEATKAVATAEQVLSSVQGDSVATLSELNLSLKTIAGQFERAVIVRSLSLLLNTKDKLYRNSN